MNQVTQEHPATNRLGQLPYSPGLEGVIAGNRPSARWTKGESGLRYRGYAIRDLATWSSFEEVAHLLLVGRLPTGV